MKIRIIQNMKSILPSEKINYIIYCRKSEESEDRQIQSIPDQIRILKEIAETRGVHISKILTESRSAKAPGRPVFNELVTELETGKYKGVICWKLNRLFRNPVDEGQIRWLLQSGKIEEIITPQKTYKEIDSDFTMAVEGAQAQRFITDLRRDSMRGTQSKIEKGIAPALAPTGYKNNTSKRQGERDISPHPTYFPLMRKIFEHALTGNYSVVALCEKAKEMGIRTHKGNIISKSQMHMNLKNPFYAGKFIYSGKMYQGIHKPMLTEEEYDLLQDILEGKSRPRKIIHSFSLTGLIKCGECGMSITADAHTKTYKNGMKQTFTYYRCSKKSKVKACKQPYISDIELREQVIKYLEQLNLSSKFTLWAVKWLKELNKNHVIEHEAELKAVKLAYDNVLKRIDSLLDMKLDPDNIDESLISNEEFALKKKKLLAEKNTLADSFNKLNQQVDQWTDFAADTFDLSIKAVDKFNNGSPEVKKILLTTIGSYLTLKDRKLDITVRTPFLIVAKLKTALEENERLVPDEKIDKSSLFETSYQPNPIMGGLLDEVRTYYRENPKERDYIKNNFHLLKHNII